VKSSPLYDQLMPIATAVTRTAQPHDGLPFKFYLVHEPGPNAFATPGGNVYMTDSLHHDSMALIEKERRIQRRELGAAVLLGPSAAHVLAIALALSSTSASPERADRGYHWSGIERVITITHAHRSISCAVRRPNRSPSTRSGRDRVVSP
jgi:hypothetical protein